MRRHWRAVCILELVMLLAAWGKGALYAQGLENAEPKEWLGVRGGTEALSGGEGEEACFAGSSASNNPSWGGFVKPMPGTVCTMNVGNSTTSSYAYKIRSCSEATDRRAGIAGRGCDVINVIELNSDAQCDCACDPTNLVDNPSRRPICAADGFGEYDPDRCALCQGCGSTPKPASCETQAEVICDPQSYYPPTCNKLAHKGCDCMCFRKGQCSLGGSGSCEDKKIPPGPASLGCDSGNYATCRKCDFDGDGSYDWGSCVAHPTHCNPSLDRAACLRDCSTPVMEEAAKYIADAKVHTISGDLNCDPRPGGCIAFGECPWVGLMASYGLKICKFDRGTTLADSCAVDLVLSNFCGCNSQINVAGPGDHATIVYESTPGYWTGPLTEILSANSASSCPDPDATDSSSDQLGAAASCPALENGQPVSSCDSWGHTSSANVRYYTQVDECYLEPEMGIPKVLVCDIATATASATCTDRASSSSSSFVTIGKADASISASCSNGTAYNPAAKIVTKSEVVMPSLVRRSDGNLYFMVERDAHRDRGGECYADLSPSVITAACDSGVTVSCTGRYNCAAVDRNCSIAERGHVTCDGVTTYCPTACGADGSSCDECAATGDCFACCRCDGGTSIACSRLCS